MEHKSGCDFQTFSEKVKEFIGTTEDVEIEITDERIEVRYAPTGQYIVLYLHYCPVCGVKLMD